MLPRLQSGLKQLPALTAPVVATTRSLASIKALPALSAPALSAASLPGLKGEAKAGADYNYYYPYDPGSGDDWLAYNQTYWVPVHVNPYIANAQAVTMEFSAELGAQVLAATGILGNGPCNCAGGTPLDVVDRATYFLTAVLDFGVSRGAGLTTKVGPAPIPKRPEALSGLTPTIKGINSMLFGPYGMS